MRVLVTGGAGYLGAELAALGQAAGWNVVTTRFRREPPVGESVQLDVAEAEAVERTLTEVTPEVVVHTAYRQADEHLERDVVAATTNVARAARSVGARLIHLSTDLVFAGDSSGSYREQDDAHPVSAYGRAKLAAERAVRELHPQALIVRTSLLYGRPGGPQEALALRDDVVFYTDEVRSPTHVGDLAAALVELATGETTGVLHVAGPDPVSRYELARLLAAAQGRNPDGVRGAPSPPGAGRARNVALDVTRAAAVLRNPPRGVREALHSL